MKKIFLIFIILILYISSTKSQILDVPYRSDLSGCGNWCWAKSAHMNVVYYGNDVYLCDILEYSRTKRISTMGHTDCCDNPYDSCCTTGPLTGINNGSTQDILYNWSINSTYSGNYLSTSQIQTELSNNRPFIIHQENPSGGGHAVSAFGFLNNDIYLQDPGNGTVIRDYPDYILGYNGYTWIGTLKMNTSATSCPVIQHIIGNLNHATSVYKATYDIYANCLISSSSDITFRCGRDIIMTSGFEVQLGSELLFETGGTIVCP